LTGTLSYCKDETGITLLGLTADTRIIEVPPPLSNLTSHTLLNFIKVVAAKDGAGITLLYLTTDTETTEVHPPLRSCRVALKTLY
ncbi:hypothetical protein, partial [Shewanella sp. 1180_01]|uniref:hypothetical protein n=1 Tax=Shewanella sp. 1180_01 TaxID=2604451 RepID=UPI0040646921